MKKQAIFEYMREKLMTNQLTENFSLPPETSSEISFVDGAIDGLSIYHMAEQELNDEDINLIYSALEAASRVEERTADVLFDAVLENCRAINIIDIVKQ